MENQPAQNVLKITGVLLLFLIAVNLLILDIKVFSTPTYTATISTNKPSPPNTPFPTPSFSPTATSTPSSSKTTTTYTSSPKEYFIPIGGGSSQINVYTDLKTTDTMIDTTTYGNIKEAYFTAGLSNPTQNGFVSAQLYNVTDGYPIYGSQLTSNGPAKETVTSGSFALPVGPKLYRIQLLSSLQAPASIENAKIRILAQ